MADIFTEVDRDLRADRAERLWKRYGSLVIGAAVAIVLATGAYVGWREWQRRQHVAAGDQFQVAVSSALRGETAAAATAAAALAPSAPSSYAMLARLAEANWLAEQGKTDEALQRYDALAATTDDPVFRDLAVLAGVQLRVDREPLADLMRRLQPLLAPSAPFRFTALELRGLAEVKAGQLDAAKRTFQSLADDLAAPGGARARASELLQAIGG